MGHCISNIELRLPFSNIVLGYGAKNGVNETGSPGCSAG
jgi:hypothetical protein